MIFHHFLFELFLAVKFNYAKPTVSFNMHVSREPQDDGYTLIPSPEKMVPERNMSESSLTIESSSDAPKRIKSPKEVRGQRILMFLFQLVIFL